MAAKDWPKWIATRDLVAEDICFAAIKDCSPEEKQACLYYEYARECPQILLGVPFPETVSVGLEPLLVPREDGTTAQLIRRDEAGVLITTADYKVPELEWLFGAEHSIAYIESFSDYIRSDEEPFRDMPLLEVAQPNPRTLFYFARGFPETPWIALPADERKRLMTVLYDFSDGIEASRAYTSDDPEEYKSSEFRVIDGTPYLFATLVLDLSESPRAITQKFGEWLDEKLRVEEFMAKEELVAPLPPRPVVRISEAPAHRLNALAGLRLSRRARETPALSRFHMAMNLWRELADTDSQLWKKPESFSSAVSEARAVLDNYFSRV